MAQPTHRHDTAHRGLVPLSQLAGTGTPSAATYLRGDQAWATPSGGGGMSNPMTAKGDLITASDGSGTPARIGAGVAGKVLTATGAGSEPTWQTVVASAGVGTYGLLVQDGASSPPVTLWTEDGADWLYADG